jgi:hypothetical protein
MRLQLGFGDGEKMKVQSDSVGGALGMFRVGKNLYLPEVLLEQIAQVRSRKKVHVTSFE